MWSFQRSPEENLLHNLKKYTTKVNGDLLKITNMLAFSYSLLSLSFSALAGKWPPSNTRTGVTP